MKLKRCFWMFVWSGIGLCVIAPFAWGALCLFLLIASGSESTLLVDKTYSVGEYAVHETIHQEGMGWPDHKIRRRYRVLADESYILGDYDNESTRGISADTPPQMIDDRLVVFSSSYLYVWKPGEEPIEFYPYLAKNWNAVFPGTLNAPSGSYDYVAEMFSVIEIEDTQRWLMTYRCIRSSCQCANAECEHYSPHMKTHPETLVFYSDDEGETFHLVPPDDDVIPSSEVELFGS